MLLEPGDRLPQADEGEAAFVGEAVGHRVRRVAEARGARGAEIPLESIDDRQGGAVAERGALHRKPGVARMKEATDAVPVDEERGQHRKSGADIVLDRAEAVGDEASALVEL
ncbi:MAG: hypothetical protein ACK55I_32575, partial [bacterium]